MENVLSQAHRTEKQYHALFVLQIKQFLMFNLLNVYYGCLILYVPDGKN